MQKQQASAESSAQNVCETSKYGLILKQINNSFTDSNTSHTQTKKKKLKESEHECECVPCKHQKWVLNQHRRTWGKEKWREENCASRPCAVSHMNEQQHMTYPQILWILFFWVARRYFQPKQTAPWLIHDRGRGWIKYSYLTHKHTANAYSFVSYSRQKDCFPLFL